MPPMDCGFYTSEAQMIKQQTHRHNTDVVPCSTSLFDTFAVHVPYRWLWDKRGSIKCSETQLTSGLSYLEFIGLSTLGYSVEGFDLQLDNKLFGAF